jgi:hypothetical protein
LKIQSGQGGKLGGLLLFLRVLLVVHPLRGLLLIVSSVYVKEDR